MLDIPARAGDEIIQADHGMAVVKKTIAEMRSDESGGAGYEMTHGPF
jgi:hypothetical protein